MKRNKITAFVCSAIALLPLHAAEMAQSFKDTQDLYGENGYVVFAYADGWDKNSQRICKQLMESESMHQLIGDAIMMEYAVPQVKTEEFIKARDERFGKLKIPRINNYPALLLYNRHAHHYATISGNVLLDTGKNRLVTVLGSHMREMLEQLRLLDAAAKEEGLEKARLLGQASTMTHINPPESVVELIRQVDPEDVTGYIRRLEFQPMKWVESLRDEPLETAMPKLEALLADPAYSGEQKQAVCACMIGMLHRSPHQIADMQRIPELVRLMKSYAPDTVLAKSGDVVLQKWVSNTIAEKEWTSDILPRTTEPVDMLGAQPPLEPGDYVVAFSYRGGSHGVRVRSVTLLSEGEKVAVDEHPGFAGAKPKDNEYLIRVRKRIEKPRWLFSFDLTGKEDTRGVINIIRK